MIPRHERHIDDEALPGAVLKQAGRQNLTLAVFLSVEPSANRLSSMRNLDNKPRKWPRPQHRSDSASEQVRAAAVSRAVMRAKENPPDCHPKLQAIARCRGEQTWPNRRMWRLASVFAPSNLWIGTSVAWKAGSSSRDCGVMAIQLFAVLFASRPGPSLFALLSCMFISYVCPESTRSINGFPCQASLCVCACWHSNISHGMLARCCKARLACFGACCRRCCSCWCCRCFCCRRKERKVTPAYLNLQVRAKQLYSKALWQRCDMLRCDARGSGRDCHCKGSGSGADSEGLVVVQFGFAAYTLKPEARYPGSSTLRGLPG